MVKKIVIPIVAAIVAVVVAVSAAVVVQHAKTGIWHEWSRLGTGVMDEKPSGKARLINSIEEYYEFLEENRTLFFKSDPFDGKYNEEFFEKKALITFTIQTGSTAEQFVVSKVDVNSNVLNIEISKYSYRYGFQVIGNEVFMVEVKKKDIKGVTEVKTEFIDTGYKVDIV